MTLVRVCAFLYAVVATLGCFRLTAVSQVWRVSIRFISYLIDYPELTENALFRWFRWCVCQFHHFRVRINSLQRFLGILILKSLQVSSLTYCFTKISFSVCKHNKHCTRCCTHILNFNPRQVNSPSVPLKCSLARSAHSERLL